MTNRFTRRPMLAALFSLLALPIAACDSPGGTSGVTDQGFCGAPREALTTVSAPIVNGTGSWTPSVVALTQAQGLAVGGIFTADRFGGFELECTGTLIAPNVVLTAAHCMDKGNGSYYTAAQVRFGVGKDLATPRAMFDVSGAHVHPSYATNEDADFTVLVLEQNATDVLGSEIAPIPINCGALSSTGFVGQDIQMVGYGATDKYGEVYGTAQKWALEEITGLSSLDITVYGNNVAGVCYGDSGGPALFTLSDGTVYTLGVLSWGDAICTREDHFMRTDKQCAFINQYVTTTTPDPCGSVTAAGTCSGGAAVYCDGSQVVTDACGSHGQVCAVTGGQARCVTPAPTCGSETAAGRCDGTTAVYCQGGTTVVTDACAARGQVCELGASGYRCADPPVVTGCGSETAAGRCDGGTAVYCANDAVVTDVCADHGAWCVTGSGGQSRCNDEPATGGCGAETAAGRCDGTTAVWCENGAVVRDTCGARGLACAASAGQYRCGSAGPTGDPCQGETFIGRCEGSDAIFCADGAVTIRHCAACGLRCEMVDSVGGVDCTY
ncbi:MAG: S1 family peptidase [Deltaproteobacteria bacterium]|nr:S1 family peptidase [Deltaproteobacteria bacterium]